MTCQVQHRWTVDFEKDWGGRSESEEGIRWGLPILLEAFSYVKLTNVIFFVSTELMRTCRDSIEGIHKAGFKLGSHGHFHILFKERWRAEQDRKISENFLLQFTGSSNIHYRAPKFHHLRDSGVYATPNKHVSLLRHMWFKEPIREDTIIYLHPFDIVGGSNPPNLFCRFWYSRPKKAYETFINLLNRYH